MTFPGMNNGVQVGINNGPIHLPTGRFRGMLEHMKVKLTDAPVLEPPEARPEPLSTLPFSHDQDFVSRNALLDQIREKSSVPGSRIVLVGLGGVGSGNMGPRAVRSRLTYNSKTRLAIEYCYQVRQQSTDTWVFWVHASNAARCEKSLRDLAVRAKIPGHQDRNVNIFQLVGNWLQDKKIGKWIHVLDNVDDDELLLKHSVTSNETQANARRFMPEPPP